MISLILSLLVPVAYIVVLGGSLSVFSTLYRRRQAAKASALAPWFATHLQRDIYLSLLYLDPSNPTPSNPTPLPPTPASPSSPVHVPQKVPVTVLKAALLHRAVEDVSRVLALQRAKPALANLLAQGKVGDDLWQRFIRAEQEMEAEIREVVEEANSFDVGGPGQWGQYIFQSASEMQANGSLRSDIFDIQARMEEDQEWWEQRQKEIRNELLDGSYASDDEDEDDRDLDSDDEDMGVTSIRIPAATLPASVASARRPETRDGKDSRQDSRSASRAASRTRSGPDSDDEAVMVEAVGRGNRKKGRR